MDFELKDRQIWIITAIVIFLLLSAGGFVLNSKKYPKVAKSVIERPTETEPLKDGYFWQGEAQDPKKLKIKKLGIDSFIQQVGKNENNEVAAPYNIYIAGWYRDSAKPGDKGLSIIDGHLDGYSKPGIFKDLKNLKPNDEIIIEKGDSSVVKYKVMKVEEVDSDKAVNYLFSQSPKIKSQLNLITCGGNYDTNKKVYDKRIIVSSELVN